MCYKVKRSDFMKKFLSCVLSALIAVGAAAAYVLFWTFTFRLFESPDMMPVSVVLNLLLELVEVILGFDLHDGEDDARNDTKDPKKNLEDQRADADFDGDLLLDDINVTAFFRNRASDFV